MREALRCLSEWRHHVEVPDGKRPCDGDGLKNLRWEMSLSSVEHPLQRCTMSFESATIVGQ
jgi:hypothetical protein